MQKAKDYLPFIFPLIAIILVVVLAIRWYKLRDEQLGQISEFAEGIEIEEVLEDAGSPPLQSDADRVELSPEFPDSDQVAMGDVRYDIVDDKVRFSVSSVLPELEAGMYQVWLKDTQSDAVKKAFVLEQSKGGYIGSAAISAETLPFEIIVTQETVDDAFPEQVVLRGMIENTDESM